MPRLTRAAQRAQQPVDEPITDATETTERSPLNEITPNASPEHVIQVEEVPKKTPARSKSKKGGKKGAKGKKDKAVEEEQEPVVVEDEPQTVEDTPIEEVVEDQAPTPSEGKLSIMNVLHTTINFIARSSPSSHQ
jgi:hypothetical protein